MQEREVSPLRVHVVGQLKRLEIFRDYRLMDDDPRKEYRNWLERRSAGNVARVTELIDWAVMLEELPTLAAMESQWRAMFPPEPVGSECDPGCPDCGGSSWRTVIREGISGAEKCSCGARPASEPAMKAYWEREKRRIAKYEADALAKWRDDMARDLRRDRRELAEPPTEAEIEAIKSAQERNRTLSISGAEELHGGPAAANGGESTHEV